MERQDKKVQNYNIIQYNNSNFQSLEALSCKSSSLHTAFCNRSGLSNQVYWNPIIIIDIIIVIAFITLYSTYYTKSFKNIQYALSFFKAALYQVGPNQLGSTWIAHI